MVCHWSAAASGQPPWRLSLGNRHVSLRRLRSLSFWLQFACSRLEFGTLFPLRFVPDSHVPCVLALPLECSIGFFGRFFSYSWAQFLVRQWIHVLHQYWVFGRIAHIFYVAADSNPEVLLSYLLQNEKRAQPMLLVVVLLHAALTWKPGHYFYELHGAATLDDGMVFRCSVRHFSASSSELRLWSAN